VARPGARRRDALRLGPLSQNGFMPARRSAYVTENPHVLGGLTSEGFSWAFNLGYTGNWTR